MPKLIINFYKIVSALLIFFCANIQCSAIELKDSDLFIKSNKLTLNQKKQSATFTGNVQVYFEDMQLQTSELIVYYVEKSNRKNITKIVIPINLTATKVDENEIVIADKGFYDMLDGKLTLTGNVRMQRNDNILVTNKMIYFANLKSNKVDNAK